MKPTALLSLPGAAVWRAAEVASPPRRARAATTIAAMTHARVVQRLRMDAPSGLGGVGNRSVVADRGDQRCARRGRSATGRHLEDLLEPFGCLVGASAPDDDEHDERHHVGDRVERELVDRQPRACSAGDSASAAPKRYEPAATLNGWRAAKITTATAMKPRPDDHVLEPRVRRTRSTAARRRGRRARRRSRPRCTARAAAVAVGAQHLGALARAAHEQAPAAAEQEPPHERAPAK